MEDQPPQFRYHSDPFATDTFVREAVTCELCGKHREVRYDGPIFVAGKADSICPWCIADGTAAEAGYYFVDLLGCGTIDRAIMSDLSQRTPGFWAWQGATWCYHCDDAGNYVGSVGRPELDTFPPKASDAVRATLRDDRAAKTNGPNCSSTSTSLAISRCTCSSAGSAAPTSHAPTWTEVG